MTEKQLTRQKVQADLRRLGLQSKGNMRGGHDHLSFREHGGVVSIAVVFADEDEAVETAEAYATALRGLGYTVRPSQRTKWIIWVTNESGDGNVRNENR